MKFKLTNKNPEKTKFWRKLCLSFAILLALSIICDFIFGLNWWGRI